MTPSTPSDPIIIRSGDGPAPEPGRRRVSITPAGVTVVVDFHEVVDVRVERGEVSAAAGGDPAAQRGNLEALRKVAQRQPMRPELFFDLGPQRAAPEYARRG